MLLALQIVVITAGCAVFLVTIYVLLGGRKLWGPERGVPFCGHPFERTWNTSLTEWTCPKCWTRFTVQDGRWRPDPGSR